MTLTSATELTRNAWPRLRRDMLIAASVMMISGLVIVLFGPQLLEQAFRGMFGNDADDAALAISYFAGFGLLVIASFLLLSRPWIFLRDLEARMGTTHLRLAVGGNRVEDLAICPRCGAALIDGLCAHCDKSALK